MIQLEALLLTGRTIDQGCGKESGKLSEEYLDSVAVCEMNEEDMKKLRLRDGDRVKVTTAFGSVVLKAKKSRRIRSSGTIFVPYGAWVNQVTSPKTGGTGMPLLKGIKVTVEPTDADVLSLPDLLARSYGKIKSSGRK
ncbi:hypothetical protein CW712_01890 [Candidatus Bathyarchaeota archaeon]|nr:MAG: hypothetical protein CW712_01890 [Candidatus Bathyarchaeota archaeon]